MDMKPSCNLAEKKLCFTAMVDTSVKHENKHSINVVASSLVMRGDKTGCWENYLKFEIFKERQNYPFS